jgi:hypothetical protein
MQKKEHQDWVTDKGRRRSMRVLLNVSVAVKGKTASNQDFDEDTRTLVVNAHGALISVAAQLAAAQEITLDNKATKTSQKCRVVYVGRAQAGKVQVGVEFVEPSPSFWQIDFAPEDWSDPGE